MVSNWNKNIVQGQMEKKEEKGEKREYIFFFKKIFWREKNILFLLFLFARLGIVPNVYTRFQGNSENLIKPPPPKKKLSPGGSHFDYRWNLIRSQGF